jgi:hypothetical protein
MICTYTTVLQGSLGQGKLGKIEGTLLHLIYTCYDRISPLPNRAVAQIQRLRKSCMRRSPRPRVHRPRQLCLVLDPNRKLPIRLNNKRCLKEIRNTLLASRHFR